MASLKANTLEMSWAICYVLLDAYCINSGWIGFLGRPDCRLKNCLSMSFWLFLKYFLFKNILK